MHARLLALAAASTLALFAVGCGGDDDPVVTPADDPVIELEIPSEVPEVDKDSKDEEQPVDPDDPYAGENGGGSDSSGSGSSGGGSNSSGGSGGTGGGSSSGGTGGQDAFEQFCEENPNACAN